MKAISRCLNCEAELNSSEGKREKKYCNSNCRASHYQKTHPKTQEKKIKRVPIEKWNKMQEELEELRKQRDNPLINAARGRDESGVNEDEVKLAKPKTSELAKTAAAISANTIQKILEKEKPKKEMPTGLSRTDRMRWMRENP